MPRLPLASSPPGATPHPRLENFRCPAQDLPQCSTESPHRAPHLRLTRVVSGIPNTIHTPLTKPPPHPEPRTGRRPTDHSGSWLERPRGKGGRLMNVQVSTAKAGTDRGAAVRQVLEAVRASGRDSLTAPEG